MNFERVTVCPVGPVASGASAAQQDMETVRTFVSGRPGKPVLLVVAFDHVEFVTSSYLRATVMWGLLCGRAHAEGKNLPVATGAWDLRPLPLYPVVSGANAEVLGEIDNLLRQRNLACLSVEGNGTPPFDQAVILGKLDEFLLSTLHLLAVNGPAAAKTLMELSPEKITVGGWNNRLADLHAARLVTRERDGKFWKYRTLAKNHRLWD